jgi:hypothetical protein
MAGGNAYGRGAISGVKTLGCSHLASITSRGSCSRGKDMHGKHTCQQCNARSRAPSSLLSVSSPPSLPPSVLAFWSSRVSGLSKQDYARKQYSTKRRMTAGGEQGR